MWFIRMLQPLQKLGTRVFASFHSDMELVTGVQKRELLSYLAGDCDPWRIIAIKRGPGTRNTPNLVPSAFDKRVVGCICYEDIGHAEWFVLHANEPKRCGCGHWFELCPVPPL